MIHDPALLPSGGILEDGAVAIADGKVVDRRSTGDAGAEIPRGRVARVLVGRRASGLVNSHTHGWGLTGIQMGVEDDYLESFNMNLLAAAPPDVYAETLYGVQQADPLGSDLGVARRLLARLERVRVGHPRRAQGV